MTKDKTLSDRVSETDLAVRRLLMGMFISARIIAERYGTDERDDMELAREHADEVMERSK